MKHKESNHRPPYLPFVIYIEKLDTFDMEHKNLVMMSDCGEHASNFVHTSHRYPMKLFEKKKTFKPVHNKMYVLS
jgi:hypothetical protein